MNQTTSTCLTQPLPICPKYRMRNLWMEQNNKITNYEGKLNCLKPISKEQAEFLIKNGYLNQEKGRYPDLYVSSRQKSGKRKKRYIPENIYNKYFGKTK